MLKRRIPPKRTPGGTFNFTALKSPAFAIYCLSALTSFLGMYTVLTFIDTISISNACSGIGRLVSGLVVDKTGPVNLSVPFTIAAALVTFLWPLAHTKDSLVAVAVLYGLASAAYVSTFQMPAYALGDIEDVGRRAGMVMTFASFGAIAGPPISGAINQATGGFLAVGYYAGELEMQPLRYSGDA
ncbi:hypothetical protein C0995_004514 [Termitomyces sp. Mi166|nr:hypothetical protein C0995_004514 [Termitomyces sp. Mi166\